MDSATRAIRLILALVVGLSALACAGSFQSQYGVAVSGDKIIFDEPIRFETDSATLTEESFAILDDVARTLHDHDDIEHVRVQGHADGIGTSLDNMDLSEQRAQSVTNYLHGKGVRQRLEAVGFGETQRLCEENSDACQTMNRRVEFVIVH